MGVIKLLFLSDTHLGFDLPLETKGTAAARGVRIFLPIHAELSMLPTKKAYMPWCMGATFYSEAAFPFLWSTEAFSPFKDLADQGIPCL